MRLSKYIVEYKESGRGKELALHQAIRIAPKFSNALNSDVTIVRSNREAEKYIYYLIDPKKSKEKRRSRNTSNYYTLIMDNSPSWKEYPKRSESVICSINASCGKNSPHIFRVFPKNGSKIGVCNDSDLWKSFRNLSYALSMNEINDVLNGLANIGMNTKKPSGRRKLLKKYDKDLSILKKAFKEFDKWYLSKKYKFEELVKEFNILWDGDWLIKTFERILIGYNGDLYKHMVDKLDPGNNNFNLISTSNLKIGGGNKEAWTDGECLMVRCDELENFISLLYSSGQL